ncbi:MAG: beta-eliminating lyase-related protein, partial [Nodosilinea sp.]
VLVGSEAFIHQARRHRKLLGGSMRQAGGLAAAGLLALKNMTQRLQIDHDNAQMLAQGLATIPGIELEPAVVETNMVFFDLAEEIALSPQQLIKTLKTDYGLHLGGYGGRTLRAVTHYWIESTQVSQLVEAIRSSLVGAG